MKLKKLALAMAIMGASSVALVGCDSSSSSKKNSAEQDLAIAEQEAQEAAAAAETASTAAAAALEAEAEAGTVVTIADGYATDCVVTSGTLTAQEVGTTAIGQYLFLGNPSSSLSATGCNDAHTGVALPDMSAPAPTTSDSLDTAVISPVTTMVQTNIAAGKTAAEAQAVVATALGLPLTTNLNQDPVAAGGDVAKAAAKVVAIAKATGQAITAITPTTETETVVAKAKTVAADKATILDSINTAIDSGDVDNAAKVAKVAESITDTVDVATLAAAATLNPDGVTTTAVTAETIATVAKTVVEAVVAAINSGTTDISAITTNAAAVSAANAAAAAAAALEAAQQKVEEAKAAAGTGATGQ